MKKITAALLPITLLLTACGDDLPPEEAVTQRVLDRWDIRIKGETVGLYDFLSPARRQILTEKNYLNTLGSMVKYNEATVKSVQCGDETENPPSVCQVTVHVLFTYGQHNLSGGTLLDETWVKEDNQWWYMPE